MVAAAEEVAIIQALQEVRVLRVRRGRIRARAAGRAIGDGLPPHRDRTRGADATHDRFRKDRHLWRPATYVSIAVTQRTIDKMSKMSKMRNE